MGVTVQVAGNDIRWNLELRGEKQVQKGLNDTGTAAEKAGESFEEMGEQATGAGKSTDKAGGKFKAAAKDAGFLDKQIQDSTKHLKDLITQLDKTGDTSLLKDIRKGRKDLGQFERLTKFMMPSDEDASDAGRSLVQKLAEGFKTGSAALKGAAVPVLAGAAIAAAPLIGSAIGAAVLGAVGVGGIIGGIALAANDPRVADAGAALGDALAAEFGAHGAAEPFVAPLLDSIAILKASTKDAAKDARAAFATIAPVLRPLTLGLAEATDRFLPRLTRGLEGAKPVVRALGEIIPDIAEAVGDLVETIAEDSDGAVLALAALRDITVELLGGFGNIVYGLQQIYEWSVRSTEAATSWAKELVGGGEAGQILVGGLNDYLREHLGLLDRSKDGSNDFAGSVDNIGESAEETAAKVKGLKDAIDELFGKTMSLDQATLAYKRGFKELNKELTEGKRTLDLNTEAGQDNEESVLRRIQQLEDLRKANANSNMGVDAANRLYEKHIEQLRRTLLNLGYNKTEVNALIDRYKAIPKSVETTIGIILKTQGSESAWAALRKAERQAEQNNAPLHAGGRASGGPVASGKTYWVGENGPELVTFGDNGYVHNAADSRAMTSGASGGSSVPIPGGGALHLFVTVRGDGQVTQALAENMRFEVRTTANGDANEYFGVSRG